MKKEAEMKLVENRADYKAAYSGENLLKKELYSRYVEHIKSLVALPNEYFSLFYKQPLEVFLAIYQVVGTSTIKQQLQAVVDALKLRRSYILPIGSKPEDIGKEKDVWTYAIFVAALLYRLPNLSEFEVTYKDKSDQHVKWNPYHSLIPQGSLYTIKKLPTRGHGLMPITLLSLIFNHSCLNWLYNNNEAFNTVLELSTTPDINSPLGRLVINSHHQITTENSLESCGKELYETVKRAINNIIDSTDKIHLYICATSKGYALAIPDIFKYFGSQNNIDWKTLQTDFLSSQYHKNSTSEKVTFPGLGKREAIFLIEYEY
ncbi:MAG: TraI domain-containing protein [Cellvibrionaceae bacterium]